jgi:mRNA-degrading endonuclease toxin of MazEF toxin-antitoxin module
MLMAKSKLTGFTGTLSDGKLDELDRALKIALALI